MSRRIGLKSLIPPARSDQHNDGFPVLWPRQIHPFRIMTEPASTPSNWSGSRGSFRTWFETSSRREVRLSRERIYLIFLLIRYTGAKLNEVLNLNPYNDFDPTRHIIRFFSGDKGEKATSREVRIPEALSDDDIRRCWPIPRFARRSTSRWPSTPALSAENSTNGPGP